MNQEIKDYIDDKFDSKFDFIYKLLDVCEICKLGVYKMTSASCYPPSLKCSNCGKNKKQYYMPPPPPHHNGCLVAKVTLMNTNQPIQDNSDDDMVYGTYD